MAVADAWQRIYAQRLKAYVVTSGVVFTLIALAHVARVFLEGPGILAQPLFDATSALSVSLAIWAFRVFRRTRPSGHAK